MKKKLIFPLLTILAGVTWLLTVMEVMPGVDWLWVVGLATAGLLSLTGGLNKISVVSCPFLLIASLTALLRQTDRLSTDHEFPILIIILGVLMLISQLSPLPLPEMFKDEEEQEEEETGLPEKEEPESSEDGGEEDPV